MNIKSTHRKCQKSRRCQFCTAAGGCSSPCNRCYERHQQFRYTLCKDCRTGGMK